MMSPYVAFKLVEESNVTAVLQLFIELLLKHHPSSVEVVKL